MFTTLDPLSRALRVASTKRAVGLARRSMTFDEFGVRCRKVAGALAGLGVEFGERVAILGPNSMEYLELYVGVPCAGRVVMPLNTRLTGPELEYQLGDAGAALLVSAVPPPCGEVDGMQVLSMEEWDELVDAAPETDLGNAVTAETLAGLFYTGGTTGASKGVMLSHQNLLANTQNMLIAAALSADDRYLIAAPLFHAAGSIAVLPCLWLGATQIVMPAFDPSVMLDIIESESITVTLGVPTMVAALNEEQLRQPRDTSSVRMLFYGGSPIPTEVVRSATRTFPNAELCNLYGATELAPLATILRHHERCIDDDKARSAGQPVLGVDCRIADDEGNELAVGEVGNVVVRGPNVMLGYWQKQQQTAAVMNGDWYITGDLGRADSESNIYLVDRAKDMMVTGGENVYSTEVEEVLYSHPMVLEATVFGIPDDKWGEAIHAVVVPRGLVTAEELIAHCRTRIAGYKVPRSLEFRDTELPKSGPGKVLKRELRKPYWEGRSSNIV